MKAICSRIMGDEGVRGKEMGTEKEKIWQEGDGRDGVPYR